MVRPALPGAGEPAGYAQRSRRNIRPSADDTGKPGGDHWPMDDHDYVIVGAGSAGWWCTMTSRSDWSACAVEQSLAAVDRKENPDAR